MGKYEKDGVLKKGYRYKDNNTFGAVKLGDFLKGECQICGKKFDAKNLVDVWFKTDIGVFGRLHGVCQSCNHDAKIRECIDLYIKKISSEKYQIAYMKKKEYAR